jgi:hypothetical protein
MIECGSAEHSLFTIIGIIVLVVFTVGFPFGLVATLVHIHRKDLRTDINL